MLLVCSVLVASGMDKYSCYHFQHVVGDLARVTSTLRFPLPKILEAPSAPPSDVRVFAGELLAFLSITTVQATCLSSPQDPHNHMVNGLLLICDLTSVRKAFQINQREDPALNKLAVYVRGNNRR